MDKAAVVAKRSPIRRTVDTLPETEAHRNLGHLAWKSYKSLDGTRVGSLTRSVHYNVGTHISSISLQSNWVKITQVL